VWSYKTALSCLQYCACKFQTKKIPTQFTPTSARHYSSSNNNNPFNDPLSRMTRTHSLSLWLAPWPISILVLSIIAGWFLQPLQSTHMTCHFNHATLYTNILPVQPLVHCTPLTQTSYGLAIFQYSVPSYNFLGSPLIITLVLLWSPYIIGQTIIFLPCDFFLSIYLLLLFFLA